MYVVFVSWRFVSQTLWAEAKIIKALSGDLRLVQFSVSLLLAVRFFSSNYQG